MIAMNIDKLSNYTQSLCLAIFVALPLNNWIVVEAAGALPPISDRSPVSMRHFPTLLHAVVWRNWGIVEPRVLADVLDASVESVRELAVSMGLPRNPQVPSDFGDRGYITLIRRNWHLLPYEQLLDLLNVTEKELALTLQEDDFLYIKLGSLKPNCPPIKYSEPSDEARRRAGEINRIVKQNFGERLDQLQEPRFNFVSAFGRHPGSISAEIPIRVAHDRESPRFIYSYFALFGDPLKDPKLDPFPDGLLTRLYSVGVNGVWLHVVLRQLAPGGPNFPEWGKGHEQRLANLRALVDRAKRHGIDVYLYTNEPRAMPKSFFASRPQMAGVQEGENVALCTSDPRVCQWLGDSLAHVFREVPGLGGIFAITASENLTNCASHGGHAKCPRCNNRSAANIITEVVGTMEEGVHRTAPNAKVIVWDWGWNGHGDAADIIAKLPQNCWLMSVSEWALPVERGGTKTSVGEYSISAVGPGTRASRHWKLANQRGLRTVAKVQLNSTWELSSVPYLPVMDLVAEHCSRLAQSDVDGLMLSWSLGGYPSLNLELAQRFSRRPVPTVESTLDELAEQHFGHKAVRHVRAAWKKFSRAFQEFPLDIEVLYRGPQQMGPANLLYDAPTGYSSTMVGLPYDDLDGWRGPYSPEVLAGQYQKVADGWAEGLADLEAALAFVPDHLHSEAAADLRVAKAAQLHFASSANQVKFILTRDKLNVSSNAVEERQLRQTLTSLLNDEIKLARQLYDLCVIDSRLGYEASNHYFYTPSDLVEKVISCTQLHEQYAVGD